MTDPLSSAQDRERARQLYYETYPIDAEGFVEALDSQQILELMAQCAEAARREERKRPAQLLCNISQILNVVKQEWGESWSEWDESVAAEVRKWQADALAALEKE